MREVCIKEIAYKKYQLHWLISHGCSIEDISCLASDWFNERLTNPDDGTLSDYIFDKGVNGSLWVCFDEFISCEYEDSGFMRVLLSESEYFDYCNDIGTEPESETVYVVQSEASYDSVRNFTIYGICREKEKARVILKEAVENSGYFEDAENPEIEADYADTNNLDTAGADWEEITIEEMPLL